MSAWTTTEAVTLSTSRSTPWSGSGPAAWDWDLAAVRWIRRVGHRLSLVLRAALVAGRARGRDGCGWIRPPRWGVNPGSCTTSCERRTRSIRHRLVLGIGRAAHRLQRADRGHDLRACDGSNAPTCRCPTWRCLRERVDSMPRTSCSASGGAASPHTCCSSAPISSARDWDAAAPVSDRRRRQTPSHRGIDRPCREANDVSAHLCARGHLEPASCRCSRRSRRPCTSAHRSCLRSSFAARRRVPRRCERAVAATRVRRSFAASSVFTRSPGTVAGRFASGRVPWESREQRDHGWLNPTSISAEYSPSRSPPASPAVYLTWDASAPARASSPCRLSAPRVRIMGVITGITAGLGILVLHSDAPRLFSGLTNDGLPLVLPVPSSAVCRWCCSWSKLCGAAHHRGIGCRRCALGMGRRAIPGRPRRRDHGERSGCARSDAALSRGIPLDRYSDPHPVTRAALFVVPGGSDDAVTSVRGSLTAFGDRLGLLIGLGDQTGAMNFASTLQKLARLRLNRWDGRRKPRRTALRRTVPASADRGQPR